jgi:hypothetical protein
MLTTLLHRYAHCWGGFILLLISCCIYSGVASAEAAKRQKAIHDYQVQMGCTVAKETF